MRIRLRNAKGLDGKIRRVFFYLCLMRRLYEDDPRWGYWQDWYDHPLHNFSLGFFAVHWCVHVDASDVIGETPPGAVSK